jgi:uncharacterized protein (TIGR03086 family)
MSIPIAQGMRRDANRFDVILDSPGRPVQEVGQMNEPEVFVLADSTLNGVVQQIRDDQWDMEMPPTFATRGTDHSPTLREVVNYHAYDDSWVPDMLAGRTMAEAGADKFAGDLLGDAPRERFAEIVEEACAAAEQVDDLDRTAHLSFGDYPVREYFWQINSFRALRAHDLAKVIGVLHGIPAALVQGVWSEVSPHAEEWRALGVFPAAVPVPDDAPLLDRLLGLTGREPDGVSTGA